MLFNSIEFLFVFLPVVLAGFLLLQTIGNLRLIIIWLVGCSLFFYAWWNPVYLLLLIFSGCVNYSLGVFLAKGGREKGQRLLLVGILFNLGLLAYFKYANFFIENFTLLTGWSFNFQYVILPLAISFYTFQQITYLVDTRKGITDPHGFLEFSLFVCFFPQLIAGPIVHHKEMLSQFGGLTDRSNVSRNLTIGFSILIVGLFKKVVIADGFGLFATPVYTLAEQGGSLATMDALAGVFSYAFQLYFDFSGYSDMAIGLGCLFGIKLPVNFFSPYRALNISDFWRMWHATLSRFLRDYVYSPLGGFLCSPRRQRFNLFATMFIGGVWHGAGWTFVVYGLCHGSYVVIHQLWRIKVSGPLELLGRKDYKLAAQLLTFLVVVFTLVIFRAESLAAAAHVTGAVFHWGGWEFMPDYLLALEQSKTLEFTSMLLGDSYPVQAVFSLLFLALAICWFFPNTSQLFRGTGVMNEQTATGREPVINWQWKANRRWAIYIALLAVASMLNLTEVSEFLYFQF